MALVICASPLRVGQREPSKGAGYAARAASPPTPTRACTGGSTGARRASLRQPQVASAQSLPHRWSFGEVECPGFRRAARATARRPSDDFRPRQRCRDSGFHTALSGIAVALNHPNAVPQEKDTLYLIRQLLPCDQEIAEIAEATLQTHPTTQASNAPTIAP